jgi:hypothetical protein
MRTRIRIRQLAMSRFLLTLFMVGQLLLLSHVVLIDHEQGVECEYCLTQHGSDPQLAVLPVVDPTPATTFSPIFYTSHIHAASGWRRQSARAPPHS